MSLGKSVSVRSCIIWATVNIRQEFFGLSSVPVTQLDNCQNLTILYFLFSLSSVPHQETLQNDSYSKQANQIMRLYSPLASGLAYIKSWLHSVTTSVPSYFVCILLPLAHNNFILLQTILHFPFQQARQRHLLSADFVLNFSSFLWRWSPICHWGIGCRLKFSSVPCNNNNLKKKGLAQRNIQITVAIGQLW